MFKKLFLLIICLLFTIDKGAADFGAELVTYALKKVGNAFKDSRQNNNYNNNSFKPGYFTNNGFNSAFKNNSSFGYRQKWNYSNAQGIVYDALSGSSDSTWNNVTGNCNFQPNVSIDDTPGNSGFIPNSFTENSMAPDSDNVIQSLVISPDGTRVAYVVNSTIVVRTRQNFSTVIFRGDQQELVEDLWWVGSKFVLCAVYDPQTNNRRLLRIDVQNLNQGQFSPQEISLVENAEKFYVYAQSVQIPEKVCIISYNGIQYFTQIINFRTGQISKPICNNYCPIIDIRGNISLFFKNASDNMFYNSCKVYICTPRGSFFVQDIMDVNVSKYVSSNNNVCYKLESDGNGTIALVKVTIDYKKNKISAVNLATVSGVNGLPNYVDNCCVHFNSSGGADFMDVVNSNNEICHVHLSNSILRHIQRLNSIFGVEWKKMGATFNNQVWVIKASGRFFLYSLLNGNPEEITHGGGQFSSNQI